MGKKVSKANKGTYAHYRGAGMYSKNKRKKLERHLKKFPEDTCAQKCLENGKNGFSYTRKAPKTSCWSHTDRKHVQLWTSIGRSGKEYLEFLKKLKKVVTKTNATITKEPNVKLMD